MSRSRSILVIIILVAANVAPGLRSNVMAVQVDHTGYDSIQNHVWKIKVTVTPCGEDSFCVRLPFPDYTMTGRWAAYSTKGIEISVECEEVGPFIWEEYYYNQGYSNQGVWIKVKYPPGPIDLTLRVAQSVSLYLPGLEYPLTHHTNNGWMNGTGVVDVHSPVIANVLAEALGLQGDWHAGGYRSEPEKIVNWMIENVAWQDRYSFDPIPASQVLTDRWGNCDEWAHAACALLLKAGIAAKVVMVGSLPTLNETPKYFPDVRIHYCLAYWDGHGWIMIDPGCSSGFTFVSRVVLGADQDMTGVRICSYPGYLMENATCQFSYSEGYNSGGYLHTGYPERCISYAGYILEHYELPDVQQGEGLEPRNNITSGMPAASDDIAPPYGERLFVNYPNPFNPVTSFKFSLEMRGRVRIDIYSIDGKWIDTVVDRFMVSGEKLIEWKALRLASGIYFARLQSPTGVLVRKIVILK